MQHTQQSQLNQVSAIKALQTFALMAITVVLAFQSIKTGNPVYVGAVAALPLAIMFFFNRLDRVVLVCFILFFADIAIPGKRFNMGVTGALILGAVYIPGLMARFVMRVKQPGEKWLYMFIGVLVLVMAIRGTGLRVLGSQTWGGLAYFNIIGGLIIYLFSGNLRFDKRQALLLAVGIMALAIVRVVLIKMGAATDDELMDLGISSVARSRYTWLAAPAYSFLPFILMMKKRVLLKYVFLLALVSLIMLTGFRSKLIFVGMVWVIYTLFACKNKKGFVAMAVLAGIGMYGLLAILGESMPVPVQRAVSFLPGLNLNPRIVSDAAGSVDWRLQIWAYAWTDLPKYLLVGRGITFDVLAAVNQLGMAAGGGAPFQAYLTHVYHSGPISITLDFGVLGLIALLGFQSSCLTYLFRELPKLDYSDWRSRWALAIGSMVVWSVFEFYAIFGDAAEDLPLLLMRMSLILIIIRSANKKADQGILDSRLDDSAMHNTNYGVLHEMDSSKRMV